MHPRDFLTIWIFHWCPEKAIYIGGHTLLWDARCAGIYTGFGISLAWALVRSRVGINLPSKRLLLVISGMFLPFALDVLSLILKIREPSNEIRFLTGILFGAAFNCYVFPCSLTVLWPRSNARPPIIASTGEYSLFLLILIASYLAKAVDYSVVFQIMNAITIFGFCSLVLILSTSIIFLILQNISHLFGTVYQRMR